MIPLMGRPAQIETPNEMQQGALQIRNMAALAQERALAIEQQRQAMQQQQQSMRDQQVLQGALAASGGDLDATLKMTAGKISPATWQMVQKHAVDTAEKYSKLTGEQLDRNIKRNALIVGAAEQLKSVPPDQYQAAYQAAAAALQRQGIEIPSQMIPQSEIGSLQLGLMTDTQIAARAKAKQDADAAGRAAELFPLQKTDLEQKTTGNVPLTQFQKAQIDAQKKNINEAQLFLDAAGGDPAKAIDLKAKVAREGRSSMNMPAVSNDALDLMGEAALAGTMPSTRNAALYAAVMTNAAQKARERGLTASAALMERFGAQANRKALEQVTKQYETLKPFAEMAEKNADILERASQSVADLGAPFLNTPLRDIKKRFGGNTKVAAFTAALLPVQADFARILNSPTAGGVLSDKAREEMQGALSPGATVGQIKAALDIFRQDAVNRRTAYEASIADLKKRSIAGSTDDSKGSQQPTPATVKVWNEKTQRFE